MPSAPKCTANNAGWNDKAVQEIVRIPKTANNLGIDTSTGSTGDPYDIAVAESINGLYKVEVIHRKSGENRTEVERSHSRGWTGITIDDCWKSRAIFLRQKQKKLIMPPSETMIWQPEFTDKILSRKHGAVKIISTLRNFFQVRDIAGKE